MDINKICPGCMREIENRGSVGRCPNCGFDLAHMAADSHQLQPFTILAGKYLVGKVIGEGGFGISYIGLDLNLELAVAVKEFYPNGFVTRESNHSAKVSMYSGKNESDVNKWKEGFINEAKNLAKFSNLNGIVEVRDFFNENNTAYIVMEYIDGMTLKQYLKQNGGKLSAAQTLEMMEPVIRSLSKVHDAGMIHRDISPDNIMITKHGGMKLLDFGAAREFAGNAEKSLSIMLKPGYAPEEQYRSRGKQGPWSDVYALTATIYKCITGVTPLESMERMREDTLKMPSELGVRLTDPQEAAIRQGMAVYAEHRIQNMDELHKILYSEKQAVPEPPPVVNEPPKPDFGHTQRSVPEIKRPEFKTPEIKLGDAEKKAVLVGGGLVCCLLLVVLLAALMPENKSAGNANRETAPASAHLKPSDANIGSPKPDTEKEKLEAAVTQDTLPDEGKTDTSDVDIADMVDSIADSVTDEGSLEEVSGALGQYLALAEEYGYEKSLGENVFRLYGSYKDLILERVNNCNQQEPSAALYMQMTMDLGDAMEYARQFESYGIGVGADEIKAVEAEIRGEYKYRLISNFDSYAEAEQHNNNVVSRSELWAKMEGVNNIDLYDGSNPEDPLRLRYEAALTLHTDSELDDIPDIGSKIGKVYDVLYDTDFSPLLIYYLSEEYGDPNATPWYGFYCYLDFDIGYLTDADRMNFVYEYYTSSYYQQIRESFREYMSEIL